MGQGRTMKNLALIAIVATLATQLSTAAAATPPHGSDAMRTSDEFAELKRQIVERPKWNNARLEQETLRRDALILATDAGPPNVVWRRTARY